MESIEITPELALCHGYLNTLNAATQGKFTRLNVFLQLTSDPFYKEQLEQLKPTLDRLKKHLALLWRGEITQLIGDLVSLSNEARWIRDLAMQVTTEHLQNGTSVQEAIQALASKDFSGLPLGCYSPEEAARMSVAQH